MADEDPLPEDIKRARSLGPRPVLLDRPRDEPLTWKDAVLALVEPERPLPEPGPDGLYDHPGKALAGGRFDTDRRLTAGQYRAAEMGMAVATGMRDGGLADIISPARALTLRLRRGAINPDLLARAVEHSPSARAADEGVLLQVRRQQKPEQGGSASPREGVFYLPASEPTRYYGKDEMRGAGPSWYGGSERIEGETLLRAPLLARGATGGKVVGDALDRLLGKGTARRVESDANKVSLAP